MTKLYPPAWLIAPNYGPPAMAPKRYERPITKMIERLLTVRSLSNRTAS